MPYVEMTVDHDEIDGIPIGKLQDTVLAVSIQHFAAIPEPQLRHYTDISIVPAYRSPGSAYYVKLFFQSDQRHGRIGVDTRALAADIGQGISRVLRDSGMPRKLLIRAFAPACDDHGEALGQILEEDGSVVT